MRRRTLLLGLPVGALAACEVKAPEPTSAPPPSPRLRVDPTPRTLHRPAETVDPTTLRLTLEMDVMIVVDPGWNTAPQELDGIFLGLDDSGEALRFTAVDEDGTALWTAQRPHGHADFALSRTAEGRDVAVLTEPAPDQESGPTATGYDLYTAERLWGPREVPGPLHGPGLLFTSSAGRRVVLSAGTGEVLRSEEDVESGHLLAEHLGTVLLTEGRELVARQGTALAELWRTPLPEGLEASAARILGGIGTTTGLAVLGDGEQPGILLDLDEGRKVAEGVTAAAYDHGLDVTVVVGGHTVRGLDQDGQERWRHEDPEELVLLTAGERLAYAQRPEEGTLVVLDTSQGLMVNPYDADLSGPLAVPELFSADAATSVRVEQKRHLVTTTLDQAYGMRE
ncbi:hypothetical protein [uncultured Brachybacterium sp.]|uniref:hypothetical protein n=1 Tax=uncultured Brachybacterium sp. TaxID=189680 RepID=UPI00262A728D|nr:hypothetical protein [uncultured Brachybacterium sp.]